MQTEKGLLGNGRRQTGNGYWMWRITKYMKMLMKPIIFYATFTYKPVVDIFSNLHSTFYLIIEREKKWQTMNLRIYAFEEWNENVKIIYLKWFLQVFCEVIKIVLSLPTPSLSLLSSGYFVFVSSHLLILIWPPNLLLKYGCYGTAIHYSDQVGTFCIALSLCSFSLMQKTQV